MIAIAPQCQALSSNSLFLARWPEVAPWKAGARGRGAGNPRGRAAPELQLAGLGQHARAPQQRRFSLF